MSRTSTASAPFAATARQGFIGTGNDAKPFVSGLSERLNGADEETLVVDIPADGVYTLVASELLDRGGDDMTYRIAIDTAAPFSLTR